MATLSIRNLTKAYNKLTVVRGISATIEDGEFVVLVGPSGCGKSTLLRMIAGLEDITSGEIAIDGVVVNDVSPKDRDIAMVFQNYALYPHMTVAENMGFSLSLKKVDKATITRRVAETAEALGLTAYLDRYPKQLSGGQRQRVATGRAIVRSPKVFLFDEPLSNLDAKLRVQMRTELKQLHQRLGVTSVYVTHDQIEAMTMADKIIVLRDGVIEQVGSPLELFDYPINVFVATFIGSPSMNLFEGSIEGSLIALKDGGALALQRTLPSGPVTVGLRPEHLDVSSTASEGIAGTVAVIEPMGSETMLMVDVAGRQVTVLARERFAFEPGASIRLLPQMNHAHFFDAAGNRIA